MGKHRNRNKKYERPKNEENKPTPDPTLEKVNEELRSMGLPTEFKSTKGLHVQKDEEAIRVGQVRKYQQFVKKKLSESTIVHIRGSRIHQDRNKLKQDDTIR